MAFSITTQERKIVRELIKDGLTKSGTYTELSYREIYKIAIRVYDKDVKKNTYRFRDINHFVLIVKSLSIYKKHILNQ